MKKSKILKRISVAVFIIILTAGLYEEAVTIMQSGEIISQFSNNEKNATTAYAGKAILISGKIKAIDKDDKGFYTIALGEDSSMSAVRCSIDSAESASAALQQKGVYVKIKGICTGYVADELGLGSDVILNRCVIETGQ
jgi:hypothetical protein